MPSSKITKSFFWSFLEQGSAKLVAMVVQIVLARLVSPEAFGLMAILLVVTQVADSVAQSGLGLALIQKQDATDASYDTALWLSLGIAGVLYAAIFLAAPALAGFYGMPELADNLRVLALVVLFNSANSIQRSWMQRRLDFRGLFKASLVAVACSGAAGIGCALAGLGIWALVVQALSQSALTCLAMAVVVPWRPRVRFNRDEAAELFGYGWKVCATGILGTFYTGVSDLVLGKVCPASDLGYYSQGRKYPVAVMQVATNATQNVMLPALAKKAEDMRAFRSAAKRAFVVGSFIIVPCSLYMAVAASPLVSLLLTDAWLPCVPVFRMTCISHALLMGTSVNLRAYMALGRSDLYLKTQIVKVAIGGIAICGTAVATHDIYLTAFAMCVSTIFNTIVVDAAKAKSVYGYSLLEQMRDILPTLLVGLAASGAAYAPVALLGPGVGALLASAVIFPSVYLGLARAFRVPAFDSLLPLLAGLKEKGGSE